MSDGQHTELRIDGSRLLERLANLAAVGAIADTAGCSRLAFTDADREGRDLVITWMRDLKDDPDIPATFSAIAGDVPEGCVSPDGDAVPDCSDGCPADGDKANPGMCGCGVSDLKALSALWCALFLRLM